MAMITATRNRFAIWISTGLVLGIVLLAFAVQADTRDTRDRAETRGEEIIVTPPPPPSPSPIQIDNGSSGGSISSDTDADVDTGGNTGGHVTTGDESKTVTEINVGPTNPSPPPPPADNDSGDVPSNPCDPRTRTTCGTNSTRGR